MAGITEDQPLLVINDGINNDDDQENKLNFENNSSSLDKAVGGGDKEMAPISGSSIHRSGSRPQLDLSGAAIQGNFEERDPTILLPNQSDDISHLALDIGGEFRYLPLFFEICVCI